MTSPSLPTVDLAERVAAAVAAVRRHSALIPRVAITLGSGLGTLAESLLDKVTMPTAELPHWPRSTVGGHAGRVHLGSWRGVPVAILSGRAHRYEGYTLDRSTFGVRVLLALGAQTLIFTNAAGGVGPDVSPGDLVLATDHLNFVGKRGLFTREELVTRVAGRRVATDHDPELRAALTEAARRAQVRLVPGILIAMHGPSYETAAEIRWAQRLGASAVCMSTVHEVTVAAELGARAASLSTITNLATGRSRHPLEHAEVTAAARMATGRLTALLEAFLDAEKSD